MIFIIVIKNFFSAHKNDCKLLSEAEHKKQNIFQRALGGDKNYHSNSSKLKVKKKTFCRHLKLKKSFQLKLLNGSHKIV